jgi:phosphoglycolate phosphatase
MPAAPSSSSRPVAVFDLDGTLADTAPDLIATLNHILTSEVLRPLRFEEARDMIGAGARALIQRGFAAADLELAPDRLERHFHEFLIHYGANLCNESRLFPHVSEALDALEGEGFILAVCTNKMEGHSVALLDALGLGHRFAAICGRDTFPWFKPDPRHLTLTIEKAGGALDGSIMVGDSITDVSTAKAAGVPSIAVSFGYTDIAPRDLGADAVIDSFADLHAAWRALAR